MFPHDFGICVNGSACYIAGGRVGRLSGAFCDNAYSFYPNSVKELASLKKARHNLSLAILDGPEIYATGG